MNENDGKLHTKMTACALLSLRVAASVALILLLSGIFQANAETRDLKEARALLEANQPERAVEVLRQLSAQKPNDPWLIYDQGVAAYAAKQYEQADAIWQGLATTNLHPKLRDSVWTQIGNVSFRRGEPFEQDAPEKAVPLYEQSREAYRIVLVSQPKNKMVLHNLKVVETRLAKLHARLAQRLKEEARNKPLEQEIQKLQAALDHQRTAQNLEPENQDYKNETRKTEQELSEKFNRKAAQEEKRADRTLEKSNPSKWEREHAEEELRKALSDFQEAKALDPENKAAQEGEQRVTEKLAKLMTKEGQQLQQEAQQTAGRDKEEAIDKYEQALEKYQQALNLAPNQQEAKKGEQEVKEALEQLNMQRGDEQAQKGEQHEQNNPAQAAQEMMDALNHYQEATRINPENTEAPPKIAALEKKLPQLLNAIGQKEQQRAREQESQNVERAIAHLEKAATAYQQSQEIQPENNQDAQKGQQEVRQDLQRLRSQLARKAQQQTQQQQEQMSEEDQKENIESFHSMLAKFKKDDKQREYEQSRRAPTREYTPDNNRIYKNW